MKEELFSEAEMLHPSPKLIWISKYGVNTYKSSKTLDGLKWHAFTEIDGILYRGYGKTENEAIVDLAKWAGIKLWNEESPWWK